MDPLKTRLSTIQSEQGSALALIVVLSIQIMLTLLLTAEVYAADQKPDLVDSSLAQQTKFVVSASEPFYPPFCSVNSDHNADGFSVELLRAALEKMGYSVLFKVDNWSTIKTELAAGKLDVLPLVGRTPEREQIFDFTFPYMKMHGSIVVRTDRSDINSVADLSGKRVAVMQGDNAEEYVQRINLDAEITTTDTFKDALVQLSKGTFDAVVMQRLPALELIKRLNLANLKITDKPLKDFSQSLCFAVQKGNSKLLSILNEGLAIAIADDTFSYLHAKWFSAPNALTNRRVRVGGDQNYPPYEFINANGEPDGYNIDMARAIAERLNIDIDIQLGPWQKMVTALEDGEIDLLLGMFYSGQRDQRFDFSPAHTLVSHVIVAHKDAPTVENLEQLAGTCIAVQRGDIMHDKALEFGYGDNLILTSNQKETLASVAHGDVDYALMNRLSALYWIKNFNIKNVRVSEKSVITPQYCFATSPQGHHLLQIFTHGISELKATGTYREIRQKWLEPLGQEGLDRQTLVKYSIFIAAPVLALLGLSLLWTYTLRQRVAQQTLALQTQIKERLKAEERLHQKFKMEAIGIMAGGIAHNFNNNLAIILASLELAQHEHSNQDKLKRLLTNARTATMRSRDLVQQI
ncbi:MAG: transporter substrate-binding domain-containing protein, partial [Desulfuromonas sp.]